MQRIQMVWMSWKASPAVSSEWKCLFCLHVRTATILLGIWHIILHAMVLSALSVIVRDWNLYEPRLSGDISNDNRAFEDPKPEDLQTDMKNLDAVREHNLYYKMDTAAYTTMFTLSFTLLLVYGAVKGRPSALLPYFCVQLFDFGVSALTATGYACYTHSMHRLVAETWEIPFRNYLLQLSPQCLSLVVLFAFIISILIKAYCINIVWRCYKFLILRQQALRSAIHYILPSDISQDRCPPVERDYSSLPNYEAACKQTPPPSYQAAVAAVAATEGDITNTPSTTTDTSIDLNTEEMMPPSVNSTVGAAFASQTTTITIPQTINASPENAVTAAVAPVDTQSK